MDQGARIEQDINGIDETRTAIDHKLDELEGQVQNTVEGTMAAVHEIRGQIETGADEWISRAGRFWEDARKGAVDQARLHPWLMLGTLVLVSYALSRLQRSSG